MNHEEWADSRYDHDRAKRVAIALVESCGLTPEGLRKRFPPPPPPVHVTWDQAFRIDREPEPEFHDESCRCTQCRPNMDA